MIPDDSVLNKSGCPIDKDEVFVKSQLTCAVRERRDHRQRGRGPELRVESRCIS